MTANWKPVTKTGAAQLLTALAKFAEAVLKLQLAQKLQEGQQTIALLKRSHEIRNERHKQNTRRPETK